MISSSSWSGDSLSNFDYYVSPQRDAGITREQLLQMVGFVNPFNASTMLVTQVSRRGFVASGGMPCTWSD